VRGGCPILNALFRNSQKANNATTTIVGHIPVHGGIFPAAPRLWPNSRVFWSEIKNITPMAMPAEDGLRP
jgi:hypothetical protein